MKLAKILVVCTALVAAGCLEESAGTVSGTVLGSTFDIVSGSAEREGGSYTIFLSDVEGFSCSPEDVPSTYLQIALANVSEETTYDAAGNVTFNSVVENVIESDTATAGTITITSLDETVERIEGTIDAQGADSAVEGDFKVDICN